MHYANCISNVPRNSKYFFRRAVALNCVRAVADDLYVAFDVTQCGYDPVQRRAVRAGPASRVEL